MNDLDAISAIEGDKVLVYDWDGTRIGRRVLRRDYETAWYFVKVGGKCCKVELVEKLNWPRNGQITWRWELV